MVDEPKKDEPKGNLPDPVMEVLKDLKDKVDNLNKEPAPEPVKTVPTVDEEREALKKTLGFDEEKMRAHERMISRQQAPLVEQSGWARLNQRSDIEKFRKEVEKELEIYPVERRTPDVMEKIYFMVKGRTVDNAPKPDPKEPAPRVASTRVSGGPGYSGTEGGASADTRQDDKTESLNEGEQFHAEKLGVDPKRYALSRNTGRDIRPLKKPSDLPPAATGADFELRRLQGSRR